HCGVTLALRDFPSHPVGATPPLFHGIRGRSNSADFCSSSTAGTLNGFSCGDAAPLSDCRYFNGGKVRYPVGQQHRGISYAAGLWRRDYRSVGALPRRVRRHPCQLGESVAAFDKHSARFGAGDNRTNDSRRADDRTDHETIGHTWRGRRQSSTTATDAGRERRYVYKQEDKCFAGLYPFFAVRYVCAFDFRAVRFQPLAPFGNSFSISIKFWGARSLKAGDSPRFAAWCLNLSPAVTTVTTW